MLKLEASLHGFLKEVLPSFRSGPPAASCRGGAGGGLHPLMQVQGVRAGRLQGCAVFAPSCKPTHTSPNINRVWRG